MRCTYLRFYVLRISVGIFLFNTYGFAYSQTKTKVVPDFRQEALVSMDFPKDIDAQELVKILANWTHKNVFIDPRVNAKIKIIAPEKMTIGEAYQAILSALEVNSLTLIETGQLIKIVPKRESFIGPNIPFIRNNDVQFSDQVYTQIFKLTYVSAEYMRHTLTRIVTAASLIPYLPTNSIIYTETGYNIRKVAELISIIDRPSSEVDVQRISLKHMHAKDAFRFLSEFMKDQIPYGVVFKIIMDEERNSLIVAAAKERVKRAREIIAQIDRPSEENRDIRGNLFVRPLMFSNAKKLAGVLNAIGPTKKQNANTEDSLLITADEETNSLIFKGNAEAFQSMKGIVRRLDEAKTQVFLDFTVVGISESSNFSWLPSLFMGTGGSGSSTIVGYQASAMTPLIVAQANSSTTTTNAAPVTSAFANDFTVGTFPGGSIHLPGLGKLSPGALLHLLQNNSYGRTLSNPQILTQDNEEANFSVGQTIIYKTQSVDPTGNVTENPQKENVDLTLNVKPNMNSTNYLSLQIEIEANTLQSFSYGIPQITKKKARQLVNFKNGQTIIISGIKNISRSNIVNTVPFIGSIPLIGYLFTNKQIRNDTEFTFIFLTAHIVRNSHDLHEIYKKRFKEQDPRKLESVTGSDEKE